MTPRKRNGLRVRGEEAGSWQQAGLRKALYDRYKNWTLSYRCEAATDDLKRGTPQ